MKNILISFLLLFSVSVLLFHSCTEKPEPPSVATIPVSAISYTTAASGGAVTYEGGSPVTGRGICWNTASDPTIQNSITTETGGFGPFTSNISQLTPNTLYYVRAYATNITGTGYGNLVTFTTRQSQTATITTEAATSITQTRAVSGGNITSENGGSVIARGVCWSTASDPTVALSTKTTDGEGPGPFISNISQLTPNTLYYIRAYATNVAGTGYGSQLTFTTKQITPATLTTTQITSITTTSAVSGGNITDEGGTVTVSGICWNSVPEPTTDLITKTTDGTGYGSFISNITGLLPGSTYYVRAYAVNESGTVYGNQIMFNTKIADADGNTYNTVTIGNQVWMAENLKTTIYNDNTEIPLIVDNSVWAGAVIPGYCWYNNDAISYKDVYGALYNWYALDTAVNGVKNLCPVGWHLPEDGEWIILTNYLGGEGVAGGKLKETGTAHWQTPNVGATNSSGFTGLPGGGRDIFGNFYGILGSGQWWSATADGVPNVWTRRLSSNSVSMDRISLDRINGYSVRCLKDN